jgi:hypothetical protein
MCACLTEQKIERFVIQDFVHKTYLIRKDGVTASGTHRRNIVVTRYRTRQRITASNKSAHDYFKIVGVLKRMPGSLHRPGCLLGRANGNHDNIVEEAIVRGILAPGDRLPSERAEQGIILRVCGALRFNGQGCHCLQIRLGKSTAVIYRCSTSDCARRVQCKNGDASRDPRAEPSDPFEASAGI